MLSLIGQLIFDGMAMGLVFVILAAGFIIIMSTSKILFFAYGMFYMLGAYAVWYAINQLYLPYFFSLVLGVLAITILGMLSYLLIFQRLKNMEGGFLATLIAAMGLSMVLGQGSLIAFGTSPRSIPAVFPGKLDVFDIIISLDKVVLIGLGIAITAFLFWVYEKTALGRELRAVSFLPEAASLQGVNVNRIYIATLGIGTALAGFAGGIMAPSYGINPAMGNNILWTVMLMVMLGGVDSLTGAVVAGLVVGQVLSFGQFFIGGTVQIILFFLIGVILFFKPAGLLGRGMDIGI